MRRQNGRKTEKKKKKKKKKKTIPTILSSDKCGTKKDGIYMFKT